MNNNSHQKYRWLTIAGVILLLLSGLGFLYTTLVGKPQALRGWLLPFGPWSAALMICYAMRRSRKNAPR